VPAEDGAGRGGTGAGFHSDGVGPAGRSGSRESAPPKAEGGHAGIVCSVGGSGGQISLWVGIAASGCAFGGQVSGPERAGGAVGLASASPAVSAGAGTVCAQDGAGFCIGTAGFGSVSSSGAAGGSSAGGLVCAQDGAVFIGRAGLGSASSVAWRASVPSGAGSTVGGTVPAAAASAGTVPALVSAGLVSTVAVAGSAAATPSTGFDSAVDSIGFGSVVSSAVSAPSSASLLATTSAGGAPADSGSSGSVSGSKAGVTRGSSGSVWSGG
jgi:hypothetical protein